MSKQISFNFKNFKPIREFGGSKLTSNPKVKRPISTKQSMHLVMRSTRARGSMSFLRFDREIQKTIRHMGKRFGVRVYSIANGGTHIHMVILPCSREGYKYFVRSISGLIARMVLKIKRGFPKGLQFWDKRPYTRFIEWGKDFRGVCAYLMQNTLEALGFIPYQRRRNRPVAVMQV